MSVGEESRIGERSAWPNGIELSFTEGIMISQTQQLTGWAGGTSDWAVLTMAATYSSEDSKEDSNQHVRNLCNAGGRS